MRALSTPPPSPNLTALPTTLSARRGPNQPHLVAAQSGVAYAAGPCIRPTQDAGTRGSPDPFLAPPEKRRSKGVVDRPTGQCPVLVMCSIAALSSWATMVSSAPSRGGYT
jgi:hypothetical protein